MLIPTFMMSSAAEENFYISENYALGKSVLVNNAYSGAPKEAAVDGESNTVWRTLTTCADDFIYLIVPFGEEVDINILRMKLYEYTRMSFIEVQYTTDPNPYANSKWEDIKIFEKQQISPEMDIIFETVKATGVRFFAQLSEKSAGLYEFELYYSNDPAVALDKHKTFLRPESVNAQIVSVGENGELIYADYNGKGAKLMDFSRVGYKNGNEPIPDVNVVKTIEAGDLDDHTALIQGAIDEVSALSLDQRGAILLKAGRYTVSSPINIKASGIVLRGEGQGENGTTIYDVRTKSESTTLTIKGSSNVTPVSGSGKNLADDYVPVGKTTLKLSDVNGYSVGNNIRIVCTPNNLWVQTLGMDNISGSDNTPWKASDYMMVYERVVTAVDEAQNSITVDTGIPLTLDKTYYSVFVQVIKDATGRATECGVENIRFLSCYNGDIYDENHAWRAVSLSNCRNCFVRNVTAKNYAFSTVLVGDGAINTTVEGCSFLEPISKVEGGRRYSFNISGQYTLVKNCYSYDSRHDYVVQARVSGPNVFLDCVAENSNNNSEPHHRWSTGSLYDNVLQVGATKLGSFEVVNAGDNGTGHGWQGASTIFWNCLSPAIGVGKPQTEQNFAVGVYGIYPNSSKSRNVSFYKKKFITPTIETPDYPEFVEYKD